MSTSNIRHLNFCVMTKNFPKGMRDCSELECVGFTSGLGSNALHLDRQVIDLDVRLRRDYKWDLLKKNA